MSELPKGMKIVDEEIFLPPNTIEENIRLKDLNYVKILLDKLEEIKIFKVSVINVNVNEDIYNTTLNLNINIKEVENNG